MNRRDFLRKLGLTTAAVAVSPAIVGAIANRLSNYQAMPFGRPMSGKTEFIEALMRCQDLIYKTTVIRHPHNYIVCGKENAEFLLNLPQLIPCFPIGAGRPLRGKRNDVLMLDDSSYST